MTNSVAQFITEFLESHMEMANASEIEIEWAHLTPHSPTPRVMALDRPGPLLLHSFASLTNSGCYGQLGKL